MRNEKTVFFDTPTRFNQSCVDLTGGMREGMHSADKQKNREQRFRIWTESGKHTEIERSSRIRQAFELVQLFIRF